MFSFTIYSDDVGQEAAVLHLTGVTPANKDDARRASKRPRVSQNETDSETTQRQSEETSSSADGIFKAHIKYYTNLTKLAYHKN